MKLNFKTLKGSIELDSDFIYDVKPFGVNQTIIEYEDDFEILNVVVILDYHEVKKVVDAAKKEVV